MPIINKMASISWSISKHEQLHLFPPMRKRRKLFNVKYLPLFHHFKAIYQFPKHIIVLVKIVANASLSKNISIQKPIFSGSNYTIQYGHHYLINILKCQYDLHYCNLITICWLIRIYGYSRPIQLYVLEIGK
jgi:hypothetical protein